MSKSETKVVNVHSGEDYDVYIGRPSPFGNPFPINQSESRDQVIARYRQFFKDKVKCDKEFRELVQRQKGKVLGCYCKPRSCHGDVICEYLNGLENEE